MLKCTKCSARIAQGDRFCPECGTDQQAGRMEGLMTIGGLETFDQSQTRSVSRDAQPELEAGTEFAGRYIIERVVGKGGMGVVYRAKDKLADKAVALKLIRAERLGGQGAVKRLISEGLTARDIRHQNIVAVYDVGDAAGSRSSRWNTSTANPFATGTVKRSVNGRMCRCASPPASSRKSLMASPPPMPPV